MSEGLIIEGVEVVVVDEIPLHSVQYLTPDHKWNPGEEDVLACNLDTYVSLDTIVFARERAAQMVRDARRAMKIRQEAEERRERRKARRLKSLTPHAES